MLKSYLSSNRIEGLVMVIVSIAGLIHTVFGKWSQMTGEQAKFFPRAVYIVVLLAGLMLMFQKQAQEKNEDKLPYVGAKSVCIFVAIGFTFFMGVLNLGLAVSTLLYMIIMIGILTTSFKKQWKLIVLPATVITVFIWIMFTWFMPIIISNALLF